MNGKIYATDGHMVSYGAAFKGPLSRAYDTIHLLPPQCGRASEMYHVVLGTWANTLQWGIVTFKVMHVLACLPT